MKRSLVILIAALVSFSALSQDLPPAGGMTAAEANEAFNDYLFTDIAPLLYEDHDYAGALASGRICLDWLDSLPAELRQELGFRWYAYIFMAEAAARNGDMEQGLEYLKTAIDNGCDKYLYVLDLECIEEFAEHPGFDEIVYPLRIKSDYLATLREGGSYADGTEADSLPAFKYTAGQNWIVGRVARYFQLDTVAGNGDEISRIINVMDWVHDQIPHNGMKGYPGEPNAIDIYHYSKATGNGVNCRMLATVLNECYLSLGYRSRVVTCLPREDSDFECHVINAVWSDSLGKWLWMDPTYSAYVTDGQGSLLGIHEVRQRLIDGLPVNVRETANWNHRNLISTDFYLYKYMAKNLYWFNTIIYSRYNAESPIRSPQERSYAVLVPSGVPDKAEGGLVTADAEWFWQAPPSL